MKLLLVEDNEVVRVTVAALLEDAGHIVTEATSIAEARACLSGARFEVVLLDLGLKDGQGTELVPDVRRLLPEARIAIWSGTAPWELSRAMDVDLVLEKGMDPELLLARLAALAQA